ncbi:MAG: WD40 repeat domain-containing protein [Planctomycetia bacterium]|nr:WD40 repeat domain-containing protein [Planctomycetia bacterium]
MTFSSDGARLASASDDRTIKLWDAETGAELRTLTGHADWVMSVTFSPDGTWLASASKDRTIKLWNAQSDAEIRALTGHAEWVTNVALSPNGARLASASADRTIKLWDTRSGAELRTFIGHASSVLRVTFSPDGARLFSKDLANDRIAWNAESGTRLEPPKEWPDFNSSNNKTPDGRWLAVSSNRHVLLVDLHFKDTPNEKEFRQFKARLDPSWHEQQAMAAVKAAPPDHYSALFHWAWVSEAKPDDILTSDRLYTTYDKYCDEFKARAAKVPTSADQDKATALISTNPNDYLAPLVLKLLGKSRTPKPSN